MKFEYDLHTSKETLYNITPQVQDALAKSGVTSGLAIIYCPHTTAGITINENADPDVVHDLILGLNNIVTDDPRFRHAEGNSTAHLKASLVNTHAAVVIEKGRLLLGRWQGIYFCEFDPPRSRHFIVKILADA
ncbi:MAG: secondary thiamine-phosphate synthase enzyme YjbQ [Erysipelotrichaceae bacterium]|nr:secondary thiamine-phosphate synthase enzyme YjbQ [Erysipelotrichaceae bacterium]